MSEGRERSWGVKYLTDKGGAMALEMLYLCKTRDVLEEQVCVCGGINVTACAYLRVYVTRACMRKDTYLKTLGSNAYDI